MDDEFKKIKFRNRDKIYIAHAIDLRDSNVSVNGNFLIWIGAFRIYDEEDKSLVGKITFQQSMLLDYLWADPKTKRYPQKNYLEEALVNLLHYIPFTEDMLIPDGNSFIFRFIRDLNDGVEAGKRIYNIKVEDSMEKTYQKKMFGSEITDEKIVKAILELLYMHRLENYVTNIPVDLLSSILPFEQNKLFSLLQILEHNKLVEILKDSSGVYISAKITPDGIEFLTGVTFRRIDQKVEMAKKIQIGHNFNIKTGNNSPVNIQADIDVSFDSIRKEIEEKKLPNKTEILEDLGQLQEEVKNPKNLGLIKILLGKIGKASVWVGTRVEPIVQQVIASYISSQLPLTKVV